MGNKIPLTVLRAHYARMAATHRWNGDRAQSNGVTWLAAKDYAAAEAAQARANAISVALRTQHMAGA